MKVSVVCIYYNRNYGSVLQSLALNRYLEKSGFEVDVIPFKDEAGLKEKLDVFLDLRLPKLFNPEIVKRKIQERKSQNVDSNEDAVYIEGCKIREKAYIRFVNKNFNVRLSELARKELTDYVKDSDAVIVGSDQLWTPHDILMGYHTLEFVPDTVKKVSYATSFGVSQLPTNHIKKKAKRFLERIDVLSVREKQGKRIIEDLGIKKKVSVVVDPTMLLTREEWDKLIQPERIVKDKFLFCYFLGNNPEHRVFAQKVKDKLGMKIVALQHMDEYDAGDRKYADEVLYNIDPGQFVSLIRDAEMILTDSFHGSVFSVLYHKGFFVLNRHKDNESRSTNSRIETLCSMLNLQTRHLPNEALNDIDSLVQNAIDYKAVDKSLEEHRNMSIDFLTNALGR